MSAYAKPNSNGTLTSSGQAKSDGPESAVRERYSAAAKAVEPVLCCPVSYDSQYLKALPKEVLERDYGCGDPSRYVLKGDTVLDLGSGGGKICFIAAQIAGPTGRVIGVDMNDDMLDLARRSAPHVASQIGYANTEFRKGKIQDLRLDRDVLNEWLERNPVTDELSMQRLEAFMEHERLSRSMIPDESIDLVVSNCVLNLVREEDKHQLFQEIYRVLKRGGRAAISDIVSDEPIPVHLKDNPDLWSGCVSGAWEESSFLRAFEEAGFYGITLDKRDSKPWQTIEGIEFRSVTVLAYKGKDGPCLDHKEAVIYKGPFRSVSDDDGHTFRRGERTAVCRKTFELLGRPPYESLFESVSPIQPVSDDEARPFPCGKGTLRRDPRETKGEDYSLTSSDAQNCGPNCC